MNELTLGLVTGFALDYGMTLTYEPVPSGRIFLISKNFPGRARTTVHKISNKTGDWGDYLRSAVAALHHADYEERRPEDYSLARIHAQTPSYPSPVRPDTRKIGAPGFRALTPRTKYSMSKST